MSATSILLPRPLDGTRVTLLINHLSVRVIHAAAGEIIRTLTKPIGGPKRPYGPHKNQRPEPK